MFVPPSNWLRRLDPAARERNERWSAFAKWTEDFPRLDDDPPATLKLWRRILVYAIAFGTAERVAKSGRIPAPGRRGGVEHRPLDVVRDHVGQLRHELRRLLVRFREPGRPGVELERRWRLGGGGGGFSGGGGGGAW